MTVCYCNDAPCQQTNRTTMHILLKSAKATPPTKTNRAQKAVQSHVKVSSITEQIGPQCRAIAHRIKVSSYQRTNRATMQSNHTNH